MIDLHQIPQLPQRQDSTLDQLQDLHAVANRLGMYDAADIVKQFIDNNQKLSVSAPYLREMVSEILDDCPIMAIKILRANTGMMLHEAKDVVYHVLEHFKLGRAGESKPLTDLGAVIKNNLISLMETEYSEVLKS